MCVYLAWLSNESGGSMARKAETRLRERLTNQSLLIKMSLSVGMNTSAAEVLMIVELSLRLGGMLSEASCREIC